MNDSGCVDNWMNQSRTRIEYDVNSCGDFDDVLHSEDRSVVCDMPCSVNVVFGDWSAWVNDSVCVGGLMNQSRTRTEYDNNSCGVFDDVVHEEMQVVNCSLPVCSLDSDCSDDYYGDRYCDGDDVHKTLYDFSCVNGSCVEETSEVFVKECDDDCEDGKCVGDDDDDDSWDDRSVVWNDMYTGKTVASAVVLGSEAQEESWMWLWILLLIIGILFLVWIIIRIFRG